MSNPGAGDEGQDCDKAPQRDTAALLKTKKRYISLRQGPKNKTMKRAEDNQKIPGQPRAKGNDLLGRELAETVSEETGQFSDEVQKPMAEAQKVLKLYEAVIKEYAVLDEAEEGAMKTLTLRLRSMSGSCTMWTRSIGRSTRHGRSQREHLRDSKTCVASIGYARSRGSRWRRGFLSHYFPLRLHFIRCWTGTV